MTSDTSLRGLRPSLSLSPTALSPKQDGAAAARAASLGTLLRGAETWPFRSMAGLRFRSNSSSGDHQAHEGAPRCFPGGGFAHAVTPQGQPGIKDIH